MNKELLNFYRERGNVPDWAWYQLNGKSAVENYQEQKVRIYDNFVNSDDIETVNFTFYSEVKK